MLVPSWFGYIGWFDFRLVWSFISDNVRVVRWVWSWVSKQFAYYAKMYIFTCRPKVNTGLGCGELRVLD